MLFYLRFTQNCGIIIYKKKGGGQTSQVAKIKLLPPKFATFILTEPGGKRKEKTMITITITETQFDKRTSADVFRAISNSFAARNKCAAAQKDGNKPRQAELHINETHVANIAVWGGGEVEDYEDLAKDTEEVFGIPTDAWWEVWEEHNSELKNRGVFVEKTADGWVIGRFTS